MIQETAMRLLFCVLLFVVSGCAGVQQSASSTQTFVWLIDDSVPGSPVEILRDGTVIVQGQTNRQLSQPELSEISEALDRYEFYDLPDLLTFRHLDAPARVIRVYDGDGNARVVSTHDIREESKSLEEARFRALWKELQRIIHLGSS